MSATHPIAPWRAIWRGLSVSWTYRLFGTLVGARALRAGYVRECVRPREGDRVLDIGCGPGDIVSYLPAVSYVGFDINPEYIQAAQARFGKRAQFFQQPVSRELLGRFFDFDIVMANGLLHHLNDAEAVELLTIAFTALKPNGRLVTLDGVISPDQSRLSRYLVSHDRGRFVRTEAEYTRLVRQVFPYVNTRILHGRLRIPYAHIVMECSRQKG